MSQNRVYLLLAYFRYNQSLQAATLLCLLLLLFFAPAIFSERVLVPLDWIFYVDPLWQPLAPPDYEWPANERLSDQVSQLYPWKVFLTRSIAAGELPLWNPYFNGGQPFLANAQSIVFSPYSLLLYLLPLNIALEWMAFCGLFLFGFFTYLFAREIGISYIGALLAMVTATFSTPIITWIGYPIGLTFTWFPLMMWLTERALSRRDARYAWGLTFAIAAQFLQGHPETSLHILEVWAAYLAFRLVALYGWQFSQLIKQGLWFVMAFVGGFGLAMVQILPTLFAVRDSATAAVRLSQAGRLFEWQYWPAILTALLPRFFGTPTNGSYWYPFSNYNEQNMYAGVLPLVLAVTITVGLFVTWLRKEHLTNKNRPVFPVTMLLFWTTVAVIAITWAIHLPPLNLLNRLPMLELVANERLRFIYVFALALLAGFALDAFLAEFDSQDYFPFSMRQWTIYGLLGFATISLLLITLLWSGLVIYRDQLITSGSNFMVAMKQQQDPLFWRSLDYYLKLVEIRYVKKLELFYPTHLAMYLPLLMAISIWALRRWWPHIRPTILGYTFVGLTIVDLFLINAGFNPTIAPEYIFPTPPAIDFVKQDQDLYRVAGLNTTLLPNTSMIFALSDMRGYDPMVPQRYQKLLSEMGSGGHSWQLFTDSESPIFDLLNVKYLFTYQEIENERWQLVYRDLQDPNIRVYRNHNVMPRAFLVYRTQYVANAEEALMRIVSDTVDFRREVLLEGMPDERPDIVSEPEKASQVDITSYKANQLELEVESPADGFLVIADTYAPGWTATVDEQPVPVRVANYALRAIPIPAGKHHVAFVYQPSEFRLGLSISLITFLILVGAMPFVWHRSISPRRGALNQ